MKKRIVCLLLALVLVIGMVPAMAMPAFAASNRSTSADGIKILKELEGFRDKIYEGNLIGYGTQVDPALYPNAISKEKATELMKEKLKGIDADINAFAQNNNMNFTQAQHDALASLSYNGIDWMNNTKFRDAVLYGKSGTEFISAIAQWCGGAVNNKNFNGLVKRRFIEANMYLNGKYSMTAPSTYTYTIFDMNCNGELDSGDKAMFYVTSDPIQIPSDLQASKTGYDFISWKLGKNRVEKLDKNTAKKTLSADMLQNGAWGEVNYKVNSKRLETLKGYHSHDVASGEKGTFAENATLTVKYECVAGSKMWIFAKGKDNKGKTLEAWVVLLPTETQVKDGDAIAVATVNVPSLWARLSATDASTQTFEVKMGEVLNILEFKELPTSTGTQSWGMIKKNGQYGWINLAYVVLDEIDSAAGGVTGGKTGTVTGTDELNVRAKAGVGETLVTTLKRGTKVSVMETVEKFGAVWGRIAWGSGNEGWVSMEYIDLTNKLEGTSNSTKVLFSATVNVDELNVRKSADNTSDKVDTLTRGTVVDVYQTTTTEGVSWGRIHSGWINLTHVTRKAASANTAAPAIKRTGTVVNCAAAVNVRAGAGVHTALVGTSPLGTKHSFYEFTTVKGVEWGYSDKGWICMLYINLDPNAATSTGNNNKNEIIETVITTTATITTSSLNIRKEADNNSDKVGTLTKGEVITIEDQKTVATTSGSKIWGKVTKDGVTGWINLAYAHLKTTTASNTNNKVESNTPATNTAPADAKDGVVYDCAAVNVRNAAGARNPQVAKLNNGTKVKVLRQVTQDNAPWAEITWDGGTGWACMYYINTNITQSNATANGTANGGTATGGTATGSGYTSGIVTSTINLNVRSAPSASAQKVDSLKPGTRVVITEQQLNGGMIWGKVTNGWVSLSYVNLDSAVSNGTGAIGQIVRCFSGVNVRSAPGTNNALLGTIQVGSTVEVLETKMHGDQEWARVGQGWISMYYVQMMTTGSAGAVNPGVTQPTQPSESTAATEPSGSTAATEEVPVVTGGVSYAFTGTVNAADGLNVRKDASKDADLAGTVNNDSVLNITSLKLAADGKTWGYFDQYGTPGWVNLEYVDGISVKGYVNPGTLNAYSDSTSSNVVATLNMGDEVEVTAFALNGSKVMGKISAPATGWIEMASLSATKPVIKHTTTIQYTGSQVISGKTLAAMDAVNAVNGSTVVFKLESNATIYFDYATIVKDGGNVWGMVKATVDGVETSAWIKLNNCSIIATGDAKEELNVRASASKDAEIKGTLAQYEVFTIYRFAFAADGKLWAQINSSSNTALNGGYVNLEYVNVY